MLKCNRFDQTLAGKPSAWTTGNRVTFSSIHHCEVEAYRAATYSIKYVLQGTEHYFLNGQKYSVSAGNFLLVNSQQPIDFFVRSRRAVTGFCLHLEEDLLEEMYAQLLLTEEQRLEDPLLRATVPPFEEVIYSDRENSLGSFLRRMTASFEPATETLPMDPGDLYSRLAQQLLEVQNNFPLAAADLGVVKNSTKKELLRRLALAREVMDAQDTEAVSINHVAQQSALSGSHLFRSFKKLYGVTPYQYLLQRKIEKAAQLLQRREMAVTDVALQCGFADLASFSKAFKKVKGVAPRAFV